MRVYATGVYIEPVRSINGKVMDPDIIANTEEELINKDIE
jgi:hypothetical protein